MAKDDKWLKEGENRIQDAEETVSVSKSEFVELIRLLTADAAEKLKEKEETKQRTEKAKARLRESLKASAAAQEEFQNGCSHKKDDGTYATGGQANNDGMATIVCLKCHKLWRITPSPLNLEAIRRGDLELRGIEPPREERKAEALVA